MYLCLCTQRDAHTKRKRPDIKDSKSEVSKLEKLNLRLKLKVKVGRGSKLRSAKRKRVGIVYPREYPKEYPKVREGGKEKEKKRKENDNKLRYILFSLRYYIFSSLLPVAPTICSLLLALLLYR